MNLKRFKDCLCFYAVKVNLQGNIKVSGGGLDGDYKTEQFHFHWGSSNSKGSEHTLNDKQYPMEVSSSYQIMNFTFSGRKSKLKCYLTIMWSRHFKWILNYHVVFTGSFCSLLISPFVAIRSCQSAKWTGSARFHVRGKRLLNSSLRVYSHRMNAEKIKEITSNIKEDFRFRFRFC